MLWLNLLLMLVLVAGHTELLVALVNRAHARPIGCGVLRQLRHFHDVLVPVFPIVLVLFVGVWGPGVLRGGRWSDLSLVWQIYLGLCLAGAAGLLVSAGRWLFRRLPAMQLSNHTQVVDVARELGFRPLGSGPFRFLTRVPGNEVFQLEVSEKVYRLPNLPVDCDGLSILHLSDLHFIGTLDRPYFEYVMRRARQQQADLIVFTGDLLDDPRLIDWLPSTLGTLTAPLGCYFILGNHDWYLDPDEIRERMMQLGWQEVAGKSMAVEHQGRPIIIGGTEVPWMGRHPDFSTSPPEAFRILLSHTPDHLEWAAEQRVDLMLSGHNHGGQVVLPVIGPVYAPSRYGVRYVSGAYHRDETLLYVSRGISGRHPLRLNCRPELTKLVLRCAGES